MMFCFTNTPKNRLYQSLKDKKVIKSLRVRNQFNVSISEVADLESWHLQHLGVLCN